MEHVESVLMVGSIFFMLLFVLTVELAIDSGSDWLLEDEETGWEVVLVELNGAAVPPVLDVILEFLRKFIF